MISIYFSTFVAWRNHQDTLLLQKASSRANPDFARRDRIPSSVAE